MLLARTGSLSISANVDVVALPAYLAESLGGARASTIDVQGLRVVFTAKAFRPVTNWNVLAPFESGTLAIDVIAREVVYELKCKRLVFLGTGAIFLVSMFCVFMHFWQAIVAAPLLWFWTVGLNLVVGTARFENFLARAIASAPDVSATAHSASNVVS